MPDTKLTGRRILVAEDEYLVAFDLRDELELAGATVLGPAPSVDAALDLIAANSHIDAAVLDINLDGEFVFAAADALIVRNVPLLFTTGYDQAATPERYRHLPRCEKPFDPAEIVSRLAETLPA
jgi:DNA-binding NarL/FixJ family response regulator